MIALVLDSYWFCVLSLCAFNVLLQFSIHIVLGIVLGIQYLLENIILNFPKTNGSHFLLAFEMLFINSNLALLQLIATATLFLASNSEETPPKKKKKRTRKKKFSKFSLNVKGTEMCIISHKNFYKILSTCKNHFMDV